MIKIEDLKDGFLYKIRARNADYGIWKSETQTFVISRIKWNDNYLFEEVHYNADKWHGTATPLEEIEKATVDIHTDSERVILEYLNKHDERRQKWQRKREKD